MYLLLFYTGLCGGIYNATSTSVTATSPNFPNEYPPFTHCTWVIDAPPQQQVRVVVETFHLHSSQDCSQNYLELQDSPRVRNLQGIPFPVPIQLPSLFGKRKETYSLVIHSLMILCEGHIQSIAHRALINMWITIQRPHRSTLCTHGVRHRQVLHSFSPLNQVSVLPTLTHRKYSPTTSFHCASSHPRTIIKMNSHARKSVKKHHKKTPNIYVPHILNISS